MSRTNLRLFGAVAISAAVFACGAFPSGVGAQEPASGHEPYAPFKIGEGLYYVGASDYSSYLIVTKAGLIVIDGGDAPTGRKS